MAEPCAADNGGQSRRACSRLAAVYPASAVCRAMQLAAGLNRPSAANALPPQMDLTSSQISWTSKSKSVWYIQIQFCSTDAGL